MFVAGVIELFIKFVGLGSPVNKKKCRLEYSDTVMISTNVLKIPHDPYILTLNKIYLTQRLYKFVDTNNEHLLIMNARHPYPIKR